MIADRRIISELVIAAAIGLAGALAVLGPADRKLAEARAQASKLRSQVEQAHAARDALAANQARLAAAEQTLASLAQQSETARDLAALYASLETLAAAHGVRIEQIDPSQTDRGSRRERDRLDPRVRRPGDHWTSLSMVVFGDLASITSYVDAIEQADELARVDLLEFLPGTLPGELMAQIRAARGAVDVSPLTEDELSALSGESK